VFFLGCALENVQSALGRIEKLINTNQLDQALRETDLVQNLNEASRWFISGLVAFKRKDFKEAEAQLRRAIVASPNQTNVQVGGHLGTLLVMQRRYDEARSFVVEAHKAFPKDAQFICNRAVLALNDQEPRLVVDLLEPELGVRNNPVIYTALISAYRLLFRIDDAQRLLETAIERFPNHGDVWRMRADLLSEVDPLKAASAFTALPPKDQADKAVLWNSSFVDLRLRNFERGWSNYEWGLESAIGKIGRPIPEIVNIFDRVRDPHGVPQDKRIIVCGEQGIGDQVLFLSALRDLIKVHPNTMYLCDSRMVPLVRRSFPELDCDVFGMLQLMRGRRDIAGYIPVGSLMKDFRPSVQSFADHRTPYLRPKMKQVAAFRRELLKFSEGKPLVGISWKGGFWERQQKTKTIELAMWEPFLSRKDMCFVCLQYGDVSKEKEFVRAQGWNVKFIDGVDFKKDLDAWLSIAVACDLIVSISTALVHFAGAAGKKVYVLLGDKQQPFVWGLDELRSIVYPDVHLVRKVRGADTSDYFTALNKIFV
jgi:tetratricopeptide (TPR) repeat protein